MTGDYGRGRRQGRGFGDHPTIASGSDRSRRRRDEFRRTSYAGSGDRSANMTRTTIRGGSGT